jgi:hypothetical protein
MEPEASTMKTVCSVSSASSRRAGLARAKANSATAASWRRRRMLQRSFCQGSAAVMACFSPSQWRSEETDVAGRRGVSM